MNTHYIFTTTINNIYKPQTVKYVNVWNNPNNDAFSQWNKAQFFKLGEKENIYKQPQHII